MMWSEINGFDAPALILFVVPAVLWVLVFAIVGAMVLKRSVRIWAVLVRLAIVGAGVVFVAGPRIEVPVSSPTRVELVFDVSRSIPVAVRARAVADAREFLEHLESNRHVIRATTIAFGADARCLEETPAAALRRIETLERLEVDRGESRLAPALRLAAASRTDGGAILRRIYTDGRVEMPLEDEVASARTTLVATGDVAVEGIEIQSVTARPVVVAGDPIPVEITYRSDGSSESAELVVALDGVEVERRDLEIDTGTGSITIDAADYRPEPGLHTVSLEIVTGGDTSRGAAGGAVLRVVPRPRAVFVTGSAGVRDAAILRALRAQGLEVEETSVGDLPATLDDAAVCILDRVAPEAVADARASAIEHFVEQGGGLLVVPRETRDELVRWGSHALGDLLPLAGIPEPPPPAAAAEPEAPEGAGLTDPDPEKAPEREVEAPTLAMVLVIDKSASMGPRFGSVALSNAKKGAIATLRELHPDDLIGVIAYNDHPYVVVELEEAKRRKPIERAIMGIEASGGTNIKRALEAAGNLLAYADTAVKIVVLLSDGHDNRFDPRPVVESMVAQGIQVHAIAVGRGCNRNFLTQITNFGRGETFGGGDVRELPKIMVAVAQKVMKSHGTRTAHDEPARPRTTPAPPSRESPPGEPQKEEQPEAESFALEVATPAVYLDQIPWATCPPVFGRHTTRLRPNARLTLSTESGLPILADWAFGAGRVATTATSLEGSWARKLVLWDAYPAFVAQLVRYLTGVSPAGGAVAVAECFDGSCVVDVRDGDSGAPRADVGEWSFSWWLEDGVRHAARVSVVGPGRVRWNGVDAPPGSFIRIEGRAGGASCGTAAYVWPPREARQRGVDLGRLRAWSRHLNASVVTCGAGVAELPPPGETIGFRPVVAPLALLLAGLFLFDLVCKRFGRRRDV